MDAKQLPARPNLRQYKKQAKDLLKACKSGDLQAIQRIKKHHPRFTAHADSEILHIKIVLADVQLVIAREHGFASWVTFANEVREQMRRKAAIVLADPRAAFIEAAVWHGTLERAEEILAAYPAIASADIYMAALLADDIAVRKFISADSRNATEKGTPFGWDALTHLCFSKYLRLDRSKSDAFVRAATVLLDAGASANTGFWETNHQPKPEWESALYGAAGVAHHASLTKLLLECGADPNDGEVPYHTPEGDNAVLKVLLESKKLSQDSLSMMLLRKADWHDYEGLQMLLEYGTEVNRMSPFHHTALHQAVRRDNAIENIDLLLKYGSDPLLGNRWDGKSTVSIAVRRGRSDVLRLLAERKILFELHGLERLIAACAGDDPMAIQSIKSEEPQLVGQLLAEGGTLLAEFTGNGNVKGVGHLLDLGVDVNVLYKEGNGYFDIAENSTALHVAAWRVAPSIVKLLIERGANIHALDGKGRTALNLAVRAGVDSWWMERRSPETVEALLQAGASVKDALYPSGYSEVDELLRQFGTGS